MTNHKTHSQTGRDEHNDVALSKRSLGVGFDGNAYQVIRILPDGSQIVTYDDSTVDAFGRLRVSNPRTVFDSKQLFDSGPLFWDDQEVSGSGTTSVYSANDSATIIAVAANTAGRRVRQTFQRFNYQHGKSQLIEMTANLAMNQVKLLSNGSVTSALGAFDDDNGVFFKVIDGILNVVLRSNVSGSIVDTVIPQSEWNVDIMDGTGISGVNLDFTKSQIFVFDFEWLGVGRVRYGFFQNGKLHYCHTFSNANRIATIYMKTSNLPHRFEVSNDGTGPVVALVQICTTTISEGGSDPVGEIRAISTGATSLATTTAGLEYALIGIRLKSTHFEATINLIDQSTLVTTDDDYEWRILLNPTIAGTFTYSDETNSALQSAFGVTANTITGGTLISSGYVNSTGQGNNAGGSSHERLINALRLGASIANVPDEMVLAVRPLTATATFFGSLIYRQVS